MSASTSTSAGRSTSAAFAESSTEQSAVGVAREMRRRWRRGERTPAEDSFALRPELLQRPEAAVEVIYEEYCLRQAAGDEDAAAVERDLLRRFPQWAGPLRVMLDCHRRLLQSDVGPPRFPAAGERLGDFTLLEELGRGSRGRVFLATQGALADRPVVLKLTPLEGAEHLSLARLQHTNIVPLYSVSDDFARGVRVLCMPYFGRATMATLLAELSRLPPAARTGRHVADALGSIDSAARQMLDRVTYAQAMCWVAACLADALHFAHERGLVHLDLKPSNVLLSGDGQPMLLDFHLAREPVSPGAPLPESFGGTPPYMPPEQHAAMRALREGKPAEAAVDRRADVYALGALLYESLGGRASPGAGAAPLSQVNAQVSPGLSDIVARCLAPRAEDRYPDAAALAGDLRRHLSDQPLAGVANRSLSERWHKWRRRRPDRLRAAGVVVLLLAAAAVLVAGAWSGQGERRRQVGLALRDGERQIRGGQFAEAVQSYKRGAALADGVLLDRALRRQAREQLGVARRLHLAHQLHRLADDVRALFGAEDVPPARMRALAVRCGEFWQKRDAFMAAPGGVADPNTRADLQDLALFAAVVSAKLPGDRNPAEARREAARLLDEAEAAFGPAAVLHHERQALGGSPALTAPPPARTAWEHCAVGRSLLASGDLTGARRELTAALRLDPGSRWINFYYGLCAHRLGHNEDAVAAFSVCVGAAPDAAGCYYNRALAYSALRQRERALGDYDRALALDPAHSAAALNRGVLHFEAGRFNGARADLRRALDHGADPAAVHYNLALVDAAENDTAGALRHTEMALQHNPAHERARTLRGTLERAAGESRE